VSTPRVIRLTDEAAAAVAQINPLLEQAVTIACGIEDRRSRLQALAHLTGTLTWVRLAIESPDGTTHAYPTLRARVQQAVAEEYLDALNAGMTYGQIAAVVGQTRAAIQQAIGRLMATQPDA
jgi:hypothetical protein